ncbi:hypothetical protein cyc_03641 [Cyclospora cayetanensis]|uniref:Uncharacterized protein n=1 Tax=Cyclospora cayetanensis TaxID=88456 RepID=A0A1D3D876_9EIME|nr:hypothetical protein cyc_03641 [Cyclospora cayetanensis]
MRYTPYGVLLGTRGSRTDGGPLSSLGPFVPRLQSSSFILLALRRQQQPLALLLPRRLLVVCRLREAGGPLSDRRCLAADSPSTKNVRQPLGSLTSLPATAADGSSRLVPTHSVAMAPHVPRVVSPQASLETPQDVPIHQRNYLASLQQVQQLAAANPQQSQELLSRWQRAAHRNPDRQAGVVVAVEGLQGLAARISGASQRTEALSQAAAATARDTEALTLGRIKKRHALLAHSLIRAVGLVEGLAVSRGVCERNLRCDAANEQLLMRIQVPPESAAAAFWSSFLSNAEWNVSETVEQLLQSLANTEALVSRLEASAHASRARGK